ncbi:2'-5' RNA ligase family protein [Micromonospora sp. CA-263727]|uniref:2'-5' RNA ligase family protein n=1 Tax=Micromonospora sp. CA-263727 TaxID=3239967 RepID=UPI003D9298CA
MLHIYLVPPPSVGVMASAFQDLLAARGVPHLSRQPVQWLHATVARFNRCLADLTGADVAALCEALRLSITEVPAFRWQIGPALASLHSITLDAAPDQPWRDLREVVRATAVEVLGEDVVAPLTGPGRPHVTVSFCTGPVAIEPHLGALAHVRAGRAQWQVSTAHLVAVHQHADAGTYSWESIASFPLG